MCSNNPKIRGDVTLKLSENSLRQTRSDTRRICCWSRTYSVAIWRKTRNKKAESLTVKALDPFSPFISLAPNIKHAMEETKYWVRLRLNNTLTAAALFNPRVYISSGTSGTYCTAVVWHEDIYSFSVRIFHMRKDNMFLDHHQRFSVLKLNLLMVWFAKRVLDLNGTSLETWIVNRWINNMKNSIIWTQYPAWPWLDVWKSSKLNNEKWTPKGKSCLRAFISIIQDDII